MEPTGRREAPPDDRLSEIRDYLSTSLRGAQATKQSRFLNFRKRKLDCFRLRSSSYGGRVAEPVIGRRFAPTRWLAMILLTASF
jgi:hypothetical protein